MTHRLPRVVSLVPSHSETLAALGADLVGVTRFCVVPPDLARHVEVVGGTKDPDVERIVALAPDVVVLNREENRHEDAEALAAAGVTVHVTFPRTVPAGIDEIERLGTVAGRAEAARSLAGRLRTELEALAVPSGTAPRVFVAVWRHGDGRYMGINADTYAHDVIERAGGANVCAAETDRFPSMTLADLVAARVDVVLLPDEPYVFRDRHLSEPADVGLVAVLCSGQDLHWYGPRSVAGVRRIAALLSEPWSPRREPGPVPGTPPSC